ncbi:MAG: YdcF family protein [Pseudomonadota bacterium]
MSTLFLCALLLIAFKYRITLIIALAYVIAITSGLIPDLLLKPLEAPFAYSPTLDWQKNNAIVLLGGGTTQLPDTHTYSPSSMAYSRINKTAQLYFACKKQHACKIIISGGPIEHTEKSDALVYEKALIKLGIPQDDFILELNSTDTQTNAEFTQVILKQSSFDQVIVVTSGIHMKRAQLWLTHFNIQAIPIASDYLKPHVNMMSLGNNFALTDFALHEYLGIVEVYLYDFRHHL